MTNNQTHQQAQLNTTNNQHTQTVFKQLINTQLTPNQNKNHYKALQLQILNHRKTLTNTNNKITKSKHKSTPTTKQ